jgi:hypothetical protein
MGRDGMLHRLFCPEGLRLTTVFSNMKPAAIRSFLGFFISWQDLDTALPSLWLYNLPL